MSLSLLGFERRRLISAEGLDSKPDPLSGVILNIDMMKI